MSCHAEPSVTEDDKWYSLQSENVSSHALELSLTSVISFESQVHSSVTGSFLA